MDTEDDVHCEGTATTIPGSAWMLHVCTRFVHVPSVHSSMLRPSIDVRVSGASIPTPSVRPSVGVGMDSVRMASTHPPTACGSAIHSCALPWHVHVLLPNVVRPCSLVSSRVHGAPTRFPPRGCRWNFVVHFVATDACDRTVEASVGRGAERRDGIARTQTDGRRRTWRKGERTRSRGERRRRRILRTRACRVSVERTQAASHQALQTKETSHRSRRVRSDVPPKRHVRERGSAAIDVSRQEVLRRDGFFGQVHRSKEQAAVRFVGRVSRRAHHGARRRSEAACLAQRPRLLALT
mmetsp:Transcript_1909/g.11697  ORF Transcript_1909/g.11697 Transcript_1909/m.11697 type:complete len:295 (-) Transcript_1909:5906-6790(-)